MSRTGVSKRDLKIIFKTVIISEQKDRHAANRDLHLAVYNIF
jgi:hypothetical protein